MNKIRMRGIRCPAERAHDREVGIHQGHSSYAGGCALKAVELTSGDPRFVSESTLSVERSVLTGRQKSAVVSVKFCKKSFGSRRWRR
jgi:hypothetical protein